MNKVYKLFINGKQPRKNSKEMGQIDIEEYSKHIVANVNVGDTFIFRPFNFYPEYTNLKKTKLKEKSFHNKEMIFEKKLVEIVDHINGYSLSVINVYIKEA